MGGFPRTWGNYKEFTDQLLTQANMDVPAYIIEQLRSSFEEIKAKEGWPDDAVPEWSIRWTYTEKEL